MAWIVLSAGTALAAGRVLLLVPESPSSPGGSILRQRIEAALRDAPSSAEVISESLDTSWPRSLDEDVAVARGIASRHESTPPSLIIALGRPALAFTLRVREHLFPNAMLMFGLADQRMLSRGDPAVGIPRVYLRVEAARTLRTAHHLLPQVRRFVVVGGATMNDQAYLDAVRADLDNVDLPITISYLVGEPLKEVLGEIGGLGDDAAVLFVSMGGDGARIARLSPDVLRTMRRATDVPIFGLSETYMGAGAIGGSVISFEQHAKDIATMAEQLLQGASAASLPAVTTPAREVFDARELERFKVAEDLLPLGSVVLFREPGTFGRREWTAVAVTAAAIVGLLAVPLLARQRNRKEARRALDLNRRLHDLVDDLLVAFATVPLSRIDDAIATAFKRTAEVTGADDLWLWEPRNGEDRTWLPLSVQSGESTLLDISRGLPPPVAARVDRQGRQPTSVVATPLIAADNLLGVLFWISYGPPLPLHTVDELRVVSETFAQLLQRKHADTAIEHSERLKNSVLSSLPSHIAVLDRDGVIIEVNDAWKRFARENGVRDLSTILPGTSYRKVCEQAAGDGAPGVAEILMGIDASCKGRPGEFEREYRMDLPGGGHRWFVVRSLPLVRDEGGAVVIHTDVTAQKDAERVLHTVSGRLIAAQESERRRIARELHDDLGQKVALLGIEIDQAAMESREPARERIRALGERVAELSVDIHRLSHGLHSSKLDALGLVSAVRGHCREMKAAGLDVVFSAENVVPTIPADVSLCLFRVVQEALNNVLRHSGTNHAEVELVQEQQTISARIVDSGQGFDPSVVGNHGGLGLVGMRERVASLGGTLIVESRPGIGTMVIARVPLSMAAPAANAELGA